MRCACTKASVLLTLFIAKPVNRDEAKRNRGFAAERGREQSVVLAQKHLYC